MRLFGRSLCLLLFLAGIATGAQSQVAAASGSSTPEPAARSGVLLPDFSFRLSRDVEEALAQLQDRWLLLNSALLQGDAALAESAVSDLTQNLGNIGFEAAPELAQAMAARGLEAARQGDDATAELAFRLAFQLDSRGSAVHFGRARAAWLAGRYFGSIGHSLGGYRAALTDQGVRRLILLNVLIWFLLSLLVSAALFIALQFATKGSRLLKDLRGRIPLPPLAGGALVAVLLLLPAFLPSGWLWLAFVWAVLLWGHTTLTERWLLGACILVLGAVPTAFNVIALSAPQSLTTEGRLLNDLEAANFRGRLLFDLGELEQAQPEDPAVLHLVADVHERLGQDDIARPYYRRVVDAESLNGAALNNLGVFHSRRRERVAAIEFLQSAADLDVSAGAAGYNLSRLYDQLLEFGNSQRYLSVARAAAPDQLEEWENNDLSAVSLMAGFERIPEIRQSLIAGRWANVDWLELLQPLILVAAILALAIAVQWLGLINSGAGWQPVVDSDSTLGSWARLVVPGLASAEAGDGGRAFLAVLVPVGICCAVAAGAFGYDIPWGVEPGRFLFLLTAGFALAVFFVVRAVTR